ncbi:MAG: hypothetical protein V4487_07500 [Chlamydiota bacterium]
MSSISDDFISFTDYKIDYNNCLGSGTQASVYEVIKRPQNEKGYFSYLFPHIYDYLFRIDENKKISTNICIKIAKSPCNALSLLDDKRSNQVMVDKKISKIKFYKTFSLFSQFKTRVNGKTFHDCHSNFKKKNCFEFRKSFVDFLITISPPDIEFSDLHFKNVMYDELSHRWEIVDGSAWKSRLTDVNNGAMFIAHCQSWCKMDWVTEEILDALDTIAREKKDYTRDVDLQLLEKIALRARSF